MSKRKATNARQQGREKILFRYSSALERGDFETVESILQEAAQDPALDKMMAEINAVYEAELTAAHTILSARPQEREDHRMVSSVIGANRLPKAPTTLRRTSGLFALAAVLLVALAAAAFIVTYDSPNPLGNVAALLQVGDATATPLPSLTPSPVPQVEMAALPPVVGCDTSQAVIEFPANGAVLTEPVTVMGIANSPNFGFYHLELSGPVPTNMTISFGPQETPVTELNALQPLSPAMFEAGEYQLRLSVFDTAGLSQASCTINIMMASSAPLPAEAFEDGTMPCTTRAVTRRDVQAHVRPSESSTLSGLLPAGTTFEVLAGGLPAPDDTASKPNWVFVKADVAGTSVQGWMSMNDAEWLPCPTLIPGGQPEFAYPTFTPLPVTPIPVQAVPEIPPPVTSADGVMCQALILVPDGLDVYSRPSVDAVKLGHIPSSLTLNILDTTFGPFRGQTDTQIVWYYVLVTVDGAPVQGWVSAEFTGPMGSGCPLPALAQTQIAQPAPLQTFDPILFTATAIVQQATETAAGAQQIVVPTVSSDGLEWTATAFVQELTGTAAVAQGFITSVPLEIAGTATALAQLSGGVPLSTDAGLQPLELTATGMVQQATEQAAQVIFATPTLVPFEVSGLASFTPTPVPADAVVFSVAATPTAAFMSLANTGNVQVVTTVALGSLPAYAPVQIVSAQYNGQFWTYQVVSVDGIQVQALDSQLSFYIRSSDEQTCYAMRAVSTAVVVRSAPEVIAPVVGQISSTSDGSQTLKVITIQAGSDRNWFLLDGGTFMGWVPDNTVTLVGNDCGQLTNITTAVTASTGGSSSTPTPFIFTSAGTFTPIPASADAGEDAVLCKVVNGNLDDIRVRSLPSTGSDSVAIGVLPTHRVADVLRTERDLSNNYVWYYVNMQFDRARVEGWVRSDTVTSITRCPTLGN